MIDVEKWINRQMMIKKYQASRTGREVSMRGGREGGGGGGGRERGEKE